MSACVWPITGMKNEQANIQLNDTTNSPSSGICVIEVSLSSLWKMMSWTKYFSLEMSHISLLINLWNYTCTTNMASFVSISPGWAASCKKKSIQCGVSLEPVWQVISTCIQWFVSKSVYTLIWPNYFKHTYASQTMTIQSTLSYPELLGSWKSLLDNKFPDIWR